VSQYMYKGRDLSFNRRIRNMSQLPLGTGRPVFLDVQLDGMSPLAKMQLGESQPVMHQSVTPKPKRTVAFHRDTKPAPFTPGAITRAQSRASSAGGMISSTGTFVSTTDTQAGTDAECPPGQVRTYSGRCMLDPYSQGLYADGGGAGDSAEDLAAQVEQEANADAAVFEEEEIPPQIGGEQGACYARGGSWDPVTGMCSIPPNGALPSKSEFMELLKSPYVLAGGAALLLILLLR